MGAGQGEAEAVEEAVLLGDCAPQSSGTRQLPAARQRCRPVRWLLPQAAAIGWQVRSEPGVHDE